MDSESTNHNRKRIKTDNVLKSSKEEIMKKIPENVLSFSGQQYNSGIDKIKQPEEKQNLITNENYVNDHDDVVSSDEHEDNDDEDYSPSISNRPFRKQRQLQRQTKQKQMVNDQSNGQLSDSEHQQSEEDVNQNKTLSLNNNDNNNGQLPTSRDNYYNDLDYVPPDEDEDELDHDEEFMIQHNNKTRKRKSLSTAQNNQINNTKLSCSMKSSKTTISSITNSTTSTQVASNQTPKKKRETKSSKCNPSTRPSTKNSQNSNSSTSGSAIPLTNNLRHLFYVNEYKLDLQFPTELLVRIFSEMIKTSSEAEEDSTDLLIRLAQVCEHWRQAIISTPSLWNRVDLSSFSHLNKLPLDHLRRLHSQHRLFQHTRHLDLSKFKADMVDRLLDFFDECIEPEMLHSLSIRRCKNVSAQVLKKLISHSGQLRSLNISGITSSHQNCQNPFTNSHTVFKPLLENCGETLRSLYMAENIITPFSSCFSMILDYCPNIEVLDISNVISLGSRCATVLIERFQQCCPKIRVLRAANICFQTSMPFSQSNGWPHLEELSIPLSANFPTMSSVHNDQIIEQLTKTSENLKLLDVRGSPSITARSLLKIPAWSLEHLFISNCPKMQDESLSMVFQKWKNSLVDVDLSWNKSEECINECVNSLCDTQREEVKLKRIQLRGSAISLDTLRRLIMHCGEQIQTIDLQSCRSLPRGIKRSFEGDDFQQLKQFVLDGRFD